MVPAMAMVTAMGTGYGPYSNGYTDEDKPINFFAAIRRKLGIKRKNNSRVFKLI
jgi:hypothetical protein